MAGIHRRDVLGRSFSHQLSATPTALWTKIYDPISGFDHVQIVFDNHQRVACSPQAIQHSQKGCHVMKMKPCGGFIKQIEGSTRRAFTQFGSQFDPLSFPTT